MKRTKIICTIGPACSDEETLTAMIQAGMNVARLNFSHGTHEEQQLKIDLIKKVRDKLREPIPILLDTKGPEYRIGTFADHKIELKDGDAFTFTTESVEGTQERVSVSYKGLVGDLDVGDIILVNDGLVKFQVKEKTATDLICDVLIGGVLSDRKSMSFPDKVLKQVYLSKQDKADLLFGIQNDVDFVACSFVSCAQDVIDVRNFLDANGGKDIQLIAKLENRAGVDNAEEILEHSAGLMVARGDLGVEIPYVELPAIQKRLITICRLKGGLAITATEMLESMISKPRPTRAEISDVANAVFDGTSAIMLSGETAAGRYPVESVTAMANIAVEAEKNTHYAERFKRYNFELKNLNDALSHSTCQLAIDTNATCIVATTRTGTTGRMICRFRAPMPIIGMTTNEKAYRQLALSWNVKPMIVEEFYSTDVLFYHAVIMARASGLAKAGDTIVITGGMTNGKSGNTNLIKVETLSEVPERRFGLIAEAAQMGHIEE
ncbi:MAG: pyruvate kinase [Clostridiales bacterium]|nr:pyruvate kinase [Clostridiales bacterium]